MFKAVRNLISGRPPVAPPVDNLSYEADAAVASGAVVTIASGKVSHTATAAEAFGVAINSAAQGEEVRVAYVMPGMVYRAKISAGTPVVGDEVGIGDDFTSVAKGEGKTGLRVLAVHGDWALVVFTEGLLF